LGHFRDAIIGILASLAKQESVRFGERIKAGMERARKDGVKLGRPRIDRKKVVEIRRRLNQGVAKKQIARELGIAPKTVRRYAATA
jgi:DNA invertase Pin-like site-specific DNA recombinase